MDYRSVLPVGSELLFPGMTCRIDGCAGRGSNAIVYEASYPDATSVSRVHHVLVKELFPYDIHGHIRRGEDGVIRRDAEAEELWQTHLLSFKRGNDVHLQLLALRPDRLGGNLNTFPLNGTLYTVLEDSGSRSLEKTLGGKPAKDLRKAAGWCLGLLDCLEVFHRQDYLHLDISLDNVLLTGEGEQARVMLIDYNSVHSIAEIQNGADIYFSAKEGFTAPETRTGMIRDLSFCTDLFSVTAVFYAALMGTPPSLIQLNRKNPPDAQDSPLLTDVPSTVREQVKKILRRGLCTLPEKRYPSCAAMRRDLTELLNRLDGLGVSHAALWEAGRRSVHRLVKNNPSLAYLEEEAELYPLRVTWEETGKSCVLEEFVADVSAARGLPVLLEGIGGIGKSTALLRTVLSAPKVYSFRNPAMIYLPLDEWKENGGHCILDRILRELRFDAGTRTMEDARHALTELLSRPVQYKGENRPVLLLLLDGLNEAPGDTQQLLREITELSQLQGVSLVAAGRVCPEGFSARKARLDLLTPQDVNLALERRGLLLPEREEMRELLRTPLMLSLFIQTALAQNTQMQCETEEQLVDAYLDALCAGTERDGQQAHYQAEAAVRLVLPAIAREALKRNASLNDPGLLFPVIGCRKMIDTRTLARVFPQWIGHGSEITAEGVSDEAWYGLIVHDILWKRLGLLVRDEAGNYHIRHQILQEHLARMDAVNRSSVRKARFRTGAVLAGLAVCAACILFLTRPDWFGRRVSGGLPAAEVPDLSVLAEETRRTCDPEDPLGLHVLEVLEEAEAGNVWQQFGMGILYEDGTGVEQDYGTARQYYLLAASHGEPNAYHRLGILYENGFGVEVSAETAEAYYLKAADLGLVDSMIRLGQMYLDGGTIRQSVTKAFRYFQQAWEKGDAEAAYLLGNMYRDGLGTEQSFSEAARLYQSALEEGWAPAAEALGDLYADENSGMTDPEAAVRYYQISVNMGNSGAREKLDAMKQE